MHDRRLEVAGDERSQSTAEFDLQQQKTVESLHDT
jgi:hypothetical protein